MRSFYAIEYAYGKLVENHGARADRLYRFKREGDMRAWVLNGPPSIHDSGAREHVYTSNHRVRAALKDELTRAMLEAQGWAPIA
jgi:hypothetical protein